MMRASFWMLALMSFVAHAMQVTLMAEYSTLGEIVWSSSSLWSPQPPSDGDDVIIDLSTSTECTSRTVDPPFVRVDAFSGFLNSLTLTRSVNDSCTTSLVVDPNVLIRVNGDVTVSHALIFLNGAVIETEGSFVLDPFSGIGGSGVIVSPLNQSLFGVVMPGSSFQLTDLDFSEAAYQDACFTSLPGWPTSPQYGTIRFQCDACTTLAFGTFVVKVESSFLVPSPPDGTTADLVAFEAVVFGADIPVFLITDTINGTKQAGHSGDKPQPNITTATPFTFTSASMESEPEPTTEAETTEAGSSTTAVETEAPQPVPVILQIDAASLPSCRAATIQPVLGAVCDICPSTNRGQGGIFLPNYDACSVVTPSAQTQLTVLLGATSATSCRSGTVSPCASVVCVHGACNDVDGTCTCDAGWEGSDCSTETTTTTSTEAEASTEAGSSTSSASSTATISSSAASSTAAASTTTASAISESASSLTSGQIAGAVVGAIAGGCLLAILIAVITMQTIKRRDERRRKELFEENVMKNFSLSATTL